MGSRYSCMDFFRSTVKKQSDSWIFPSGKGLTLSGINAAGIDTFSDVPINSITRDPELFGCEGSSC